MNAQEKFEYWLDIAQYDLSTAQSMLDSGRWLYTVFCCQQAVEKLVKGLYIFYVDDNVPRIHNINALIDHFVDKLKEPISEKFSKLFKELTGYYISNRYPDYISKINEQMDKNDTIRIHNETKEAFAWLLTLKPQE